jgi:hypothetical protein
MLQYEYGVEDVFWQIVRLGLLAYLIQAVMLFGPDYGLNDSKYAAGAIGLAAYYGVIKVLNTGMFYIFGYEALSSMDVIFLEAEEEKNVSNVIACTFFEPLEFESTKADLLSRVTKMHKCKSKLVKKFGLWYYVEMSEQEWAVKRNDTIVLKTGVHNEKDLVDFMVKEQGIRETLHNAQWKFYIFPDYSKDRSAVIIKFHHSFTDGIGVCTFLHSVMSNGYDAKNLPGLKPLPFYK